MIELKDIAIIVGFGESICYTVKYATHFFELRKYDQAKEWTDNNGASWKIFVKNFLLLPTPIDYVYAYKMYKKFKLEETNAPNREVKK